MIKRIAKEFCSTTTIHGFSYIIQPSQHKIEKFFWILSVLTAFILTGVLIHKLIVESQKNPTIIYIDENAVNVEDISFPAVSICYGIAHRDPCTATIDYENLKSDLKSGKLKIEEISDEQLKYLQVLSLISHDEFMSQYYPTLQISTDYFEDNLEQMMISMKAFDYSHSYTIFEWILNGIWISQYQVDTTRTLSDTGFCLTFNLADQNEIYSYNTSNLMDPKLFKLANPHIIFARELSKVSSNNPQKGQKPGLGLFLEFHKIMCGDGSSRRNKDYEIFNSTIRSLYRYEKSGLFIRIYDPNGATSTNERIFHLIENSFSHLRIVPKIYKIDDSLKGDSVQYRNCYLSHEYKLEFFNAYSKAKCEHECLAQMILKSCGCIKFFMVRNSTMKICGTSKEKCFREVEKKFDAAKSACKCYEACERVDYEVTQQRIDKFTNKNIMRASIEFAKDVVYPLSTRKSFLVAEFFPFVGGILGLLAGFSLFSGVEILYHFVVIPILEIKRMKRTQPCERNTQTNAVSSKSKVIFDYVKTMMDSSSVHGLCYIGNDNKNIFESFNPKNSTYISSLMISWAVGYSLFLLFPLFLSLWMILFMTFITLSGILSRNVYLTYNAAKVEIVMDGTATKVDDIPFPAITIVRDIELKEDPFCDAKITDLECDDEEYVEELFNEFRVVACSIAVDTDHYFDPQFFIPKHQEDFMRVLKLYMSMQPNWFERRNAIWNERIEPPFANILTSTTYGYTFNLMEQNTLMNVELLSPDFYYSYENKTNLNFPWKTSAGYDKGLTIEIDMTDKYQTYKKMSTYEAYISQCFRIDSVTIHPSNELPMKTDAISISRNSSYYIQITPEITKADEYLNSLDPNIRKCYYENERKLYFFKIYTQKNCELECISRIIYEECECIPYNYIRDPKTPLCGHYQNMKCVRHIESFPNYTAYDHFYDLYGSCRCFSLCSQIKYSFEIFENIFRMESRNNNILINVGWKDSEYYAMVRYQPLNLVDFLSYIGGILGLFAGVSVLSIIEVFYFLTLRLITDVVRFYKQ